MFRKPVVQSSRGGPGGGGAVLTDTGRAALAEYRLVEAAALDATEPHVLRLKSMLADISEEK